MKGIKYICIFGVILGIIASRILSKYYGVDDIVFFMALMIIAIIILMVACIIKKHYLFSIFILIFVILFSIIVVGIYKDNLYLQAGGLLLVPFIGPIYLKILKGKGD